MSVQDPPKGELPITGVYTMGSTSSVGQSCSSDLDIWVCHQSWRQEQLQFYRNLLVHLGADNQKLVQAVFQNVKPKVNVVWLSPR